MNQFATEAKAQSNPRGIVDSLRERLEQLERERDQLQNEVELLRHQLNVCQQRESNHSIHEVSA